MPHETANTPLAGTRGGESDANAAVPGYGVGIANADPEGAVTERAGRLFLGKVRHMPGVARVEPLSTGALETQRFRVYVRDVDAEYAVYQAQREVYDQHPEARLDVEILEEADLPADMRPVPSPS
jgi:hypothetical protein